MSLISDIILKLVGAAAPRIIDNALPLDQPKDFNAGWRRVVSYVLGGSVSVYFGSILMMTMANSIGIVVGHPIPHYAEFMVLMGNVSTDQILTAAGALLGWGTINAVYNHQISKIK